MTTIELAKAIRHSVAFAFLLASGVSAIAAIGDGIIAPLTMNGPPGQHWQIGGNPSAKLVVMNPYPNDWVACDYKWTLRSAAGGFDYDSGSGTFQYGVTTANLWPKATAAGSYVLSVTGAPPKKPGWHSCQGQASVTFTVDKVDLNLDVTQAASGGVISGVIVTPALAKQGDPLTLKVDVVPSNIGVDCRLHWRIIKPDNSTVVGGGIAEVKGQSATVFSQGFNAPSYGYGMYTIKVSGEPQGQGAISACKGEMSAALNIPQPAVIMLVPSPTLPTCPAPYATAAVQLYGTGSITCELQTPAQCPVGFTTEADVGTGNVQCIQQKAIPGYASSNFTLKPLPQPILACPVTASPGAPNGSKYFTKSWDKMGCMPK